MVEVAQPGKVWLIMLLSFLCWAIPAAGADTAGDLFEGPSHLFTGTHGTGVSNFGAAQVQAREKEMPYLTPAPHPKPKKAPPLPLHTLEGVGGAMAVPIAYLVNPGPEGTTVGMPAVSFTYLNTSKKKDLQTLAITQTFWRSLELGYALMPSRPVPQPLAPAQGLGWIIPITRLVVWMGGKWAGWAAVPQRPAGLTLL